MSGGEVLTGLAAALAAVAGVRSAWSP